MQYWFCWVDDNHTNRVHRGMICKNITSYVKIYSNSTIRTLAISRYNFKTKGVRCKCTHNFIHCIWSFGCVSYLMNTAEENYVEPFSSYSSNFHPYSISWDTFIPTKCGLNSLRYVPLSHKKSKIYWIRRNIFSKIRLLFQKRYHIKCSPYT